MEDNKIFSRQFGKFSHYPTVFLITGYICYWIKLYIIRKGTEGVSTLPLILSISFYIFLLIKERSFFSGILNWFNSRFKRLDIFNKYFFILSLAGIAAIIIIVMKALLLPPHLCQEFDALNYHITIPKQHLILGGFKHIHWSSADLRLLPLEFSLAPYWLVGRFPAKFSQILFVLGLPMVLFNLARKLNAGNLLPLFILIVSFFASHGIGIQMGTLMLELAICYLFIAAIDSFLEKRVILSAIEFSFFFWSKPFMPIYILIAVSVIALIVVAAKKFSQVKVLWGFCDQTADYFPVKKNVYKFVIFFILASLFVGGPFLLKSLYYAGTPLFPFFPGIVNISHIDKTSTHWQSIITSSELNISLKDAYGAGKGLLPFIKHLWILAVPENGVNNRFDYPLGLPYLLFLGPFIYFLIKSFREQKIAILPLFTVIYWLLWWRGSQQSRFLFIPLVLIFVTVSCCLQKSSRIFLFSLLIALTFNIISILRSHIAEFSLSTEQVLRERDKELIKMNKEYYSKRRVDVMNLEIFDVAYADFPVRVLPSDKDRQSPFWVLKD